MVQPKVSGLLHVFLAARRGSAPVAADFLVDGECPFLWVRHGNKSLADRCTVIAGSFFESIPTGADAYLLRHIIHDWTDEQCKQILGHCRKAILANGKLLIADCVVPGGNSSSPSKDLDMTMLAFPGGQERTEAQFRSLLKASGFELKSITRTTTMINVLEGKPV